MYCTNCGKVRGPDAIFCTDCGFRFPADLNKSLASLPKQISSMPVTKSGDWPSYYTFSRLPGEEFYPDFVFEGVEIARNVGVSSPRYEGLAPQRLTVPTLLVTNKRIILLDRKKDLLDWKVILKRVPIEPERRNWSGEVTPAVYSHFPGGTRPFDSYKLGPTWVLNASVNEEFDREFRRAPATYANWNARGAWWVHGICVWNWVGEPVEAYQGPVPGTAVIRFPKLVRIQAIDQWGPGRPIPESHPEGDAVVTLQGTEAAARLKKHINTVIEPLRESPFSEAYIASVPTKPMSAGFRAYTYIFWLLVAPVVILVFLAPVMSVARSFGLHIPPWIIIFVLLVGCLAAYGFLRQREKRGPKQN